MKKKGKQPAKPAAKKPRTREEERAERKVRQSERAKPNKPRREPKAAIMGTVDKSGRRWYTQEERVAALTALDANGGNIQATARKIGMPWATLASWANGIRHPEALRLRDEFRGDMATALEQNAWLLVDCLPDKIGAATLSQLAHALGISIDKMRLLRDQPTSYGRQDSTSANLNLNVDNLTPDERTQLHSLFAKLRGPAAPAADLGSGLPGSGSEGAGEEVSRPVPAVLG